MPFREIQKFEAKINEKVTALENNRKVLTTQQELLEKKKQKELELVEKVHHSAVLQRRGAQCPCFVMFVCCASFFDCFPF